VTSISNLSIRAIRLRGFRGMLTPFELTLPASKASCVVHGRNGHGKSSITDAWEFLHKGKIEHLAKEGAGVDSYAHRRAAADESYVEVEFSDPALGVIRCYTDGRAAADGKVTKEKLSAFRAAVPHPCHIRFEDLSRFVYLTKTVRHDALAALMGFTKQVETQKSLRRVQKQLTERVRQCSSAVEQGARELAGLLGTENVTDTVVFEHVNATFAAFQAPAALTDEALDTSVDALAMRVATDAHAVALSAAETFHRAVNRLSAPSTLPSALTQYASALSAFRTAATTTVNAVLSTLLNAGAEVLRALPYKEGDPCPLCGQSFAGNLSEHVETERRSLLLIRELRDQVTSAHGAVTRVLPPQRTLAAPLEIALADAVAAGLEWSTSDLESSTADIEKLCDDVRPFLARPSEQLDEVDIARLMQLSAALGGAESTFAQHRTALASTVEHHITTLRADSSRASLVAAHTQVTRIVERWRRWQGERVMAAGMEETARRFDAVVDDYVAASIADVEQRFALISDDVEKFFGILETNTPGIQRPALRLLADQDRAVLLEIEFRGEVISPAYKFLSESQLNSFGLAVFLASVRRFNPAFRFLILDDVVNSFDGQKRPQVIRLLKQEFSEFQIVLLTHDRVWWAQLAEAFKSWSRFHIVRYEPSIGPILTKGRSDIESVEAYLNDDDPRAAGGLLGSFLERRLQEACEAFQVQVAYNQRNEYTLSPLLTRFRVRVAEKLGNAHPVTAAALALESDMTFRNFTAHWKDPDIELTTDELHIVVERWRELDARLTCAQSQCHGYPQYDGSAAFVCDCGALRLNK
jgi:hypothetical protein